MFSLTAFDTLKGNLKTKSGQLGSQKVGQMVRVISDKLQNRKHLDKALCLKIWKTQTITRLSQAFKLLERIDDLEIGELYDLAKSDLYVYEETYDSIGWCLDVCRNITVEDFKTHRSEIRAKRKRSVLP